MISLHLYHRVDKYLKNAKNPRVPSWIAFTEDRINTRLLYRYSVLTLKPAAVLENASSENT